MSEKKLILVLGATGAQGLAVIDALLAAGADGSPSPYAIRALTRNPDNKRAQDLKAKGVELVKGSFEDFPIVYEALKGVYGAWINTDGFTVGEVRELYAGMRIFELAKQVGTVRHYIWSNLDYSTKKGNYNPDYKVEHYDGKGRVGEWMKAQESDTSVNGMTWSAVTTGPYMDMLKIVMFGPLKQLADGTFVFASSIGNGHVPMIALSDLGFFARYFFDHRVEVSERTSRSRARWSAGTGPDGVVETVQARDGPKGGSQLRATLEREARQWRQNFSAFWRQWRDDVITRDMEWIKSVNPNGHTLESWMRANNYTGKLDLSTLKSIEDAAQFRTDAPS
ncbi:NAD(P)-binding protein [Phellopilus nigrolimitatus]|nr:NAD(P)-binding protein [Phellopilus nigrolimitatus]